MRPSKRLLKIAYAKKIPVKVTMELTYNCNLKCFYCYVVKQNKKELELNEIKEFIDEIKNLGTLFVTLTGGEPFLRPDIFEIISYLREKKFAVHIITNGTLLNEKAIKTLAKLNPVEVSISLHGATSKTHDYITGVEGSFELAINAIKQLKSSDLYTTARCTILRENVKELKKIKSICDEFGITCLFDPLVTPKDNGDQTPVLHRADATSLYEVLKEGKVIPYISKFPEDDAHNLLCSAGITNFCLSPYGDVKPCIQIPIIAGNIRKRPLKEIWQKGEILNTLRNMKPEDIKECFNCPIREFCNRCHGLAYLESGSIFKKAPSNCFWAEINKKAFYAGSETRTRTPKGP